ncbi:hypothetical protein V5799_023239 [Amblyomma americanum]|uniref:E3 ubiquitin-protein ligase rbbp6 n=1 Tax=Amblyomma americanum TaxID=6943 RepID=A0AAQ4FI43_AMBAM
MMLMSSQEYDPSKYVKSRSMTGPLPPNYTCFRCGKSGHWIKNCPTNNIEVKRSTGIPRSFMVTVDGPDHKGALLTSTGEFAVPLIDHEAYKEVKKEKPPFVREPTPEPVQEPQLPDELLCMICHDLLQDAVLIPCCGNSFCDDCVRQALLDSEQHECPVCHETDISPNNLIPNRFLRTAVLNFKNETGYTRVRRGQVPSSAAVAPPAAATSSPRVGGAAEGSPTPPPVARPEERDAEKQSPAKGVPASGDAGDVVDTASSLDAVAAPVGSDDASRSPPAVGTPGENPPGTPLADEHPDEPAAPSLDEALTMSPQHRSNDEHSPLRGPNAGGSPSSFGNGEESVCTISTITTRVPSYAGPIALPGRSNRDSPLDPSRGPPGRGSLHRSSRHGDYGHHRSRHDYGPGGSLRSAGDYRSGGYPPYSGSGAGMGGGGAGGSYPPPPLHLPPPPQGHHLPPPNLPPPPFPGQAPPPGEWLAYVRGLAGMNVVPPHFSIPAGAGYIPPAKPFGPADDYHGRRRSYSPRSRSRSYSRSRSRSRSPVRHRRSRSPRSPSGGGEGRRRAGSKSPHGRRSRSGSYRSRSRSPGRSSRRGRHHYHGNSHGSGRPYRRSRTPRSPRSYHHHPLPPPPPHHIGPPPHGYRSRSPAFRGHRRGFYGGPPGGYPHHHPGYPHHPSEHIVPPVEFDGRSGHYYPPHHQQREGINPAYRGYPPGYPPDSLPPPPHRGDSRGNDRFESGGPSGMPSRGYHGDPGNRRERSRSDYPPPPPEALPESSSKGSRESRSREHRRHPEQITTPLVVSRDGADSKESSTRLDSEDAVKSRKRSKEKEEKLLRHKHHHRSKESRKEVREAPLPEGAVKVPKASSTAVPPEGSQQAVEVKAEASPAPSKETAKAVQELVKVEGEEPLSSEGTTTVKERKHKHKKKLKHEEALKKMSAKVTARTSDESSQQPPGADDEPLKRKKKKKKPREARLLTKSLLLTPPDLSREQSMVAFLTAELEQGVPDAARLSKIEEQLELAKKKLLGDEREEAKVETSTAEASGEAAAAQGSVDDIWDKTELEPEPKEQSAAPKEEENVLQVEVPELSKWEREELEGEESPLPPSEPVEEVKEAKPLVSSEVLQRAENVLLHKPRKKAMVAAAAATAALSRLGSTELKKLPSKVAPPDDAQPTPPEEPSSQSSVREVKESWKDSSVPLRLRDRLDGTLQVTITSTSEKERRSVTTSDKEQRGSSSEGAQPTKRVKLDRSKFGEKHSRAESREASDSTRPPKSSSSSSSRRDDRGRSDDRAPPDHDRRLPPEDARSRLDDRRALEAGGHSRVLPPSGGGSSRSDRELARSSRSGRARDKDILHRSSGRDGHSDERRRYKDERYYAALQEERARRAYEEARHKQMEAELAHSSRRKAQEEYRSRHAGDDTERVRSHERRMDMLRPQGKGEDRGDDHRSRRPDWSAEQAASLPSAPQTLQRSRSREKSDRSPHSQRHHREKVSRFAPPHPVAQTASSGGGGTSGGGQESRATSSAAAAKPLEKKLSPGLTAAEAALRHRKESTQDESRFEPDYDEIIDEEPVSGSTADAALLGAKGAGTKRRAVTVTDVSAGKRLRPAEEEVAVSTAKASASPATSATQAVAAAAAQSAAMPAALASVVSADDSSSSSDSSDDEVTSHKKHKKKHKKHKKHKHKHKKKKKSKKADKSD